MKLSGKRVVVIGGTSGIGFAVAEGAAAEGADVVIASSSKERVESALGRLPAGVDGRVLDVTREEEVAEFFTALGPFDHLAFTAGDPLQSKRFETTTVAEAHDFFEVRFWGAYAVARYGAATVNPGGSFVLSSGGQGERPRKGWPAAAAEAAAAEALARALALQLAPVRVNVVRPGPIWTEIWQSFPKPEEMFTALGSKLPVGRGGRPEEAAAAYLYLMKQDFATGTVLAVDGGSPLP
ncbi:SDR family oxidoreductase [Actinoplanes sp. N902-109]|uniref:SDR family oxidoreductase n=1 Tax=Actinoplanes sp. (strain N902-109) TaxID=649831 RepID=UPI00032943F2|nr:SDR family oxidoreductase [Actinoplanes sp. N902-109]AGL15958.1 hypothetical protein L083_2448 [Actinoplanes sp. N902-109]